MEIILLSKFNLDSVIDSAWQDWSSKQQAREEARQAATIEATEILSNQFQSEIDEIFEKALQEALGLKVLPLSEISIFSVTAHFEYLGANFYLRRIPGDLNSWEINYLSNSIACPSDCLRQQVLVEVSGVKKQLMSDE